MGTPHAGMSKDAMLSLQSDTNTGPSQFQLSLLKQSEMLQEITDQFSPLMKQFYLHYFWEQLVTLAKDFTGYIVDEDSVAPAWDTVDRCGISATHSEMVKFTSHKDASYRVVLSALIRSIETAPGLIKIRWNNDQKLLAEERRREIQTLSQSYAPQIASHNIYPVDLNKLYFVPRCSSNYFTGRKMQARMLKDKFSLSKQHPGMYEHKVFVIYGLGGSGKTQFCLKYIEDNRSRYGILAFAEKPAKSRYILGIGESSG